MKPNDVEAELHLLAQAIDQFAQVDATELSADLRTRILGVQSRLAELRSEVDQIRNQRGYNADRWRK